jgi:hypothetical protein
LACIVYKIVVATVKFLACVDKYLCSPRGVQHYEDFSMKCNFLRVRSTYLDVFFYHRVQRTFCTYRTLVFSVVLLLQLITFLSVLLIETAEYYDHSVTYR